MSVNAGQPIVEESEEDQANSVHSQGMKQRSDTMTSNQPPEVSVERSQSNE